jgi:hypothetical protein
MVTVGRAAFEPDDPPLAAGALLPDEQAATVSAVAQAAARAASEPLLRPILGMVLLLSECCGERK